MSTAFTIEKRDGWRVSVVKVRKNSHDDSLGGYTATVEQGAGRLVGTFRIMRDGTDGRRRRDEFRWYAERYHEPTPIGSPVIDAHVVNAQMRKDTLRECAECCLRAYMSEESARLSMAEDARIEAEEQATEEAAARNAVEALRARFGIDGREVAYRELEQMTYIAKQWQGAVDTLTRLLWLADPKRFERWTAAQSARD